MELGYRNAAITHDLTTDKGGAVSITWAVTEGRLHVVKDVNVTGVVTTKAGLVEDAITLAPGEAVNQSSVDTTRRNLYDLGSFRRVDVDFGDSMTESTEAGDLPVTLTIEAEEPQRFQLKYGVQFSSDRSTGSNSGNSTGLSVELRDRNFIGRAVQASVGGHWDPEIQTVAVLFSSPRLFGKRVRTNLYMRARQEQEIVEDESSSYNGATLDDRRRNLTLEQRWRPARTFELVWGYNLSSRQFLLNQMAGPNAGAGLLAGPIFSVIFDKRDSPFDATRGMFHSSSFQFGIEPFGSDFSFVRYLMRQSSFSRLASSPQPAASATARFAAFRVTRRSASSICCSRPVAPTACADIRRSHCRPSTSPTSRSGEPICSFLMASCDFRSSSGSAARRSWMRGTRLPHRRTSRSAGWRSAAASACACGHRWRRCGSISRSRSARSSDTPASAFTSRSARCSKDRDWGLGIGDWGSGSGSGP